MSASMLRARARRRRISSLIAASLAVAGFAVAAPAGALPPSPVTDAFTSNGSWIVPPGVTSVDVIAKGSNGGGGNTAFSGNGGRGAIVTATFPVSRGETFVFAGIAGGPGGGGAGAGGDAVKLTKSSYGDALVAGGGGGGSVGGWTWGFTSCACNYGSDGGDAGRADGSGANGYDGQTGDVSYGGKGATTTGVGAGGLTTAGQLGQAGVGSSGGGGGNTANAGGGGGSGYFGGGGGGGSGFAGTSGGGGAGSSWVDQSATASHISTATSNGAWSISFTYTALPVTAPLAPSIDSIDVGNAQLLVHVTPGYDGGSDVTNYEYSLDNGSHWAAVVPSSTTSPITINGLTNGTTYTVTVRAVNSSGAGTPSPGVQGTPTAPAPPGTGGAAPQPVPTPGPEPTPPGPEPSPVAPLNTGTASGTGANSGSPTALHVGTDGDAAEVPLPPSAEGEHIVAATATGPSSSIAVDAQGHVFTTNSNENFGGITTPLTSEIVNLVPMSVCCDAPAAVAAGEEWRVVGYWLVAADGGVFSFGAATFHGSASAMSLNSPVVSMAQSPSGGGYWLVSADGGVFSFGDAAFHGSGAAMRLNSPIVSMMPTASGDGYWLVAADGGVFTFGDATFHGSGAATGDRFGGGIAMPSEDGYWLINATNELIAYRAGT